MSFKTEKCLREDNDDGSSAESVGKRKSLLAMERGTASAWVGAALYGLAACPNRGFGAHRPLQKAIGHRGQSAIGLSPNRPAAGCDGCDGCRPPTDSSARSTIVNVAPFGPTAYGLQPLASLVRSVSAADGAYAGNPQREYVNLPCKSPRLQPT